MNQLIPVVTLLILDLVWLKVNQNRYQRLVQNVQNQTLQAKLWPSLVAYSFMILGLWYIILPLTRQDPIYPNSNSWVLALKYGALFGLVVYGIYNATNYAIFQNYDLATSIMDTIWGSFVYFITTWVMLRFAN